MFCSFLIHLSNTVRINIQGNINHFQFHAKNQFKLKDFALLLNTIFRLSRSVVYYLLCLQNITCLNVLLALH